MRRPGRLLSMLVVISSLAAAGRPARAQECVRIEAIPEQSTLTVRSSTVVSSIAPATLCELEPGRDYLLTVSRTNFEKRTVKFSFAVFGEAANFAGVRLGRVGRSLVLPGWGQYTLGYDTRGVEVFAFFAASAFKIKQAYEDYSETEEKYNFFTNLARESSRLDVIERANETALKAAKDANRLREHAFLTAALTGWIYAGNLFETLLLASPPKASPIEGTAFSVEIPKRSRARAAFRSLFFPGMGQKYYGNHGKGLFFQSAFIVLAYYTLDAKMRYDLAAVDYRLAFDRYEQAASVQEIQAAQAVAKAKFEAKDDRKEKMFVFAASAGAIWFLNVLDTIVFGDVEEPPEQFEFDTSYESATVRMGLRVNF